MNESDKEFLSRFALDPEIECGLENLYESYLSDDEIYPFDDENIPDSNDLIPEDDFLFEN